MAHASSVSLWTVQTDFFLTLYKQNGVSMYDHLPLMLPQNVMIFLLKPRAPPPTICFYISLRLISICVYHFVLFTSMFYRTFIVDSHVVATMVYFRSLLIAALLSNAKLFTFVCKMHHLAYGRTEKNTCARAKPVIGYLPPPRSLLVVHVKKQKNKHTSILINSGFWMAGFS